MKSYIQENFKPGQWVIDPFGSSPLTPFEIVAAGNSIIVVCNNPILQLYLEVLASAPGEKDFYAALAVFSKEKHLNERLESHLQSLYETKCPKCGQTIQVQAFVWKRGENQPVSKIMSCPSCKADGEFPVSREDILKLEAIGNDSLHRARALQRVNINPEVQAGAEEVINTYLARPLYFLFTIINRLDRVQLEPFQRMLLVALLIHALDLGNSIWPWPAGRTRPKQIAVPGHFLEHNLWQAMEKGIQLWCIRDQPVPFSVWPELPPSPGICLYRGRISGLSPLDKINNQPAIVMTVLPRPNQAFWSLSAVWSGWLWGKNAVNPMRSALERKRFDWFWFSSAIHQSFLNLKDLLGRENSIFGLMPEAETGFLTAGLIAAEAAGFNLHGIAVRRETQLGQCYWKPHANRIKPPSSLESVNCMQPVESFLKEKNEPADHLNLYLACLTELLQEKTVSLTRDSLSYFAIRDYQQKIASLLEDPDRFYRYRIQVNQSEYNTLWPASSSERPVPTLADRVEDAVRDILQATDIVSLQSLDQEICRRFPGLFTPDFELIKACLFAYGEEVPKDTGLYQFKEIPDRSELLADQKIIREGLVKIGEKFGFTVNHTGGCAWNDKVTGEHERLFHFITNASISSLVFSTDSVHPGRNIILFPDHVLSLLEYKLRANPRLLAALQGFGNAVPYSLISHFLQRDGIHYSDFTAMLNAGFSSFEGPSQISIFK